MYFINIKSLNQHRSNGPIFKCIWQLTLLPLTWQSQPQTSLWHHHYGLRVELVMLFTCNLSQNFIQQPSKKIWSLDNSYLTFMVAILRMWDIAWWYTNKEGVLKPVHLECHLSEYASLPCNGCTGPSWSIWTEKATISQLVLNTYARSLKWAFFIFAIQIFVIFIGHVLKTTNSI